MWPEFNCGLVLFVVELVYGSCLALRVFLQILSTKDLQENQSPIGHFRYIKIKLDSEAWRTQTKKMNKHGHSISFVYVP